MNNQNGSQLAAFFVLAALVLFTLGSHVLKVLPLAGTNMLLIKSGKIVVDSNHAQITHGDEATQALNCISQYAPFKAFRQPIKGSKDAWHLLCQYPYDEAGTNVFDVIVEELEEGVFRLKTTFRPQDGTLQAIEQWLLRKNVQQVSAPTLPFPVQFLP
ncbi:MAG: hypothetical protein DWQ07_17595 [Chloroflexi bacterium]|nr:MAG: hypothetical protein DWQ07_17595 [Chloroflexota bacterium]